jgi:hypothetical protein
LRGHEGELVHEWRHDRGQPRPSNEMHRRSFATKRQRLARVQHGSHVHVRLPRVQSGATTTPEPIRSTASVSTRQSRGPYNASHPRGAHDRRGRTGCRREPLLTRPKGGRSRTIDVVGSRTCHGLAMQYSPPHRPSTSPRKRGGDPMRCPLHRRSAALKQGARQCTWATRHSCAVTVPPSSTARAHTPSHAARPHRAKQ